MSGILIPFLSDAALPEFMALCIRQQDERDQAKKDFNIGTHKNDTNNLVFQLFIEYLGLKIKVKLKKSRPVF